MKTKCPQCSRTFTIPDAYENRTLKCPDCKVPYEAVPYEPVKPKRLPVLKPTAETIDSPGMIFHVLTAFCIVIGLLAMASDPSAGVSLLLGGLFLSAIGGILNRLERIAHHLERMRSEQKTVVSSEPSESSVAKKNNFTA